MTGTLTAEEKPTVKGASQWRGCGKVDDFYLE